MLLVLHYTIVRGEAGTDADEVADCVLQPQVQGTIKL